MRYLELDFFLNFSGHVPNAPWNRAQVIISFFVRPSRANTEIKQSLSLLRRDGRIGSSTIAPRKAVAQASCLFGPAGVSPACDNSRPVGTDIAARWTPSPISGKTVT